MPPPAASQSKAAQSKRITVLEESERAQLYDRPQFTDDERVGYFTLPPIDVALMETFTDGAVQAFFVLTLGYFKAKQRFFAVTLDDVQNELRFIRDLLSLPATDDELRIPNPRTIQEQRTLILKVTGYRHCRAAHRQAAFQVAQQAARISPKPQYLVRVVLQHFATERIILPGYSYLQEEIVGQAITAEENRLIGLLTTHLSETDREALESLFLTQDGRYHLTRLQRAPKNLGRGELRRERDRGVEMIPFYELAIRLLEHLDLSPDAVRYYASLVGFYTATRLKVLEAWMVYVYILCFLRHRYHRIHDHLLSGFIQAVKGYRDDAKTAAEAQVSAYRLQRTKDLVKAGRVLHLFTAETIPPTTPFATAQAQAFAILDRDRLTRAADYIATGADCDETAFFWQHIDAMVHQFKPRLRPLLLGVDLSATRSHPPLLDAVQFLQQTFARNRPLTQVDQKTIPTRCIPPPLKRYLYAASPTGPQLLVDRYEFFVYQQVRAALESGELVCRQSIRFRSLEDDLIPLAEWQENKDRYIAETERPILQQPIAEHLAELEHALESQFAAVNGRIAAGDNPAVAVTQHGTTKKWTLKDPKGRELINHALFERLPQASLNQVLAFVDRQCGFMAAFEYAIGRNAPQTRDDRILRACLVAWGTNHGLHRMGEISDIAPSTLVRVSGNYVRLETLQAANTIIVNALAASPLFREHHIDGVVHSSSDGQKFEVDRDTVNARYSPKYFGMGKGVVAATLVINGVPVNARLISAHDHESHWVFDLLYNNPTDIQPEIHSTDTHGTNQVNFGLLHIFGHRFAPRYADLQEKMRTSLYGFQHPSQYGEDALFRPVRKLNTELIVRQ